MSEHYEILDAQLTNFAGMTEKDLAAGRWLVQIQLGGADY